MNGCERFHELIENGAYFDPGAGGFDELAEHAAKCPDCAALLNELRAVESGVRDAFRWADPGAGFDARVMREISTPRRAVWPRRLLPLAAAAGIALALLITALPARQSEGVLRPARSLGDLALVEGGKIGKSIPLSTDVTVSGKQAAFEVVPGVGLALRPTTVFRVEPGSTQGFTKVNLVRGAAAVSVKTDNKTDKLEVALDGFSVLTNDADFLVETRTSGTGPSLYVDRGRVVVSFSGGVSAVEAGEHIELARAELLSRVHAGEARIKEDLATLEEQCADLRHQIARYEEMVQTYSLRRNERSGELELAQSALATASDETTARELGERVNKEMAAVENLDFVMGEHIAKMTELRAELPTRLTELRHKRTLATGQKDKCKKGLALLATLR